MTVFIDKMTPGFHRHSTRVEVKIIRADKNLQKHAVTFQVQGERLCIHLLNMKEGLKKKHKRNCSVTNMFQ